VLKASELKMLYSMVDMCVLQQILAAFCTGQNLGVFQMV